jgi:hypothetical protein
LTYPACCASPATWKSSSAAAASAPPVAKPCSPRAISSHASDCATANSALDTTIPASAASSTGRRPISSDSRPNSSSELRTPMQYTAKTSVSRNVEKPHCSW